MIDIELDDRIVQQMDRIEQDRLWIADRFDRIRLLPDLLFFLLSFLIISYILNMQAFYFPCQEQQQPKHRPAARLQPQSGSFLSCS